MWPSHCMYCCAKASQSRSNFFLFFSTVNRRSSVPPLQVRAQVLRYGLGRPVITQKIGNWSVFVLLGWRFVFGIIIK